jgi:hypothetical protein
MVFHEAMGLKISSVELIVYGEMISPNSVCRVEWICFSLGTYTK